MRDHTTIGVPAGPTRAGKKVRAGSIVGTHAVVDSMPAIVLAILAVLEARLEMTPGQTALIVAVGAACSGLVQPVAAWFADRFAPRLVAVGGILLAAGAFGSVGQVTSFEQLLVLQIVASLGVGAFHPPAAAAVGKLCGRRRALGVAFFFVAGMMGAVVGYRLGPLAVSRVGLENIHWLYVPVVLVAAGAALALRGVSHHEGDGTKETRTPVPENAGERWRAVWLLYAGNVLRFTCDASLIYLLLRWSQAFTLERNGAAGFDAAMAAQAGDLNGWMLAARQFGMAVGGLVLGVMVKRGLEKSVLISVPLAGAGAMALMAFSPELIEMLEDPRLLLPLAVGLVFATGFGYAGPVPVTVAVAQRLLPHRTSMASGLMLGGSWGFAFVGPLLCEGVIRVAGLQSAMLVVAVMLAASAGVSALVSGRLLQETAR
ncbi:MAG: MFS transporter [Phycisphaerales bacterium]|nr:MFS transporter [Phycisphaerales bacterium]